MGFFILEFYATKGSGILAIDIPFFFNFFIIEENIERIFLKWSRSFGIEKSIRS